MGGLNKIKKPYVQKLHIYTFMKWIGEVKQDCCSVNVIIDIHDVYYVVRFTCCIRIIRCWSKEAICTCLMVTAIVGLDIEQSPLAQLWQCPIHISNLDYSKPLTLRVECIYPLINIYLISFSFYLLFGVGDGGRNLTPSLGSYVCHFCQIMKAEAYSFISRNLASDNELRCT